jgi:Mn-dependent DtxR family transcriptional regulator
MSITESVENYLEAILVLGKDGSPVRAVDIAAALEFSKPSVSVALRNMREAGYIDLQNGRDIVLTEEGQTIAEQVYERHVLISEWLMFLGVKKEIALRDACRMEHGISQESYDALKRYLDDKKQ